MSSARRKYGGPLQWHPSGTPRKPEISQLGLLLSVDQNVGRLNISVEDILTMCVVQRLCQFVHDLCGSPEVGALIADEFL